MARFLTTKQISSHLEELIQEADKVLYLVSPYLKLSRDFQELISTRNNKEKKTIIIYGKYELTPDQLKFLTGLRHVYLKFHENLHAKCYINDTKLIITSLNFYEYSMINNKEIGVLYDTAKSDDLEIYNKALDHIKFIEEHSDGKPFELDLLDGKVGSKYEVKSNFETGKERNNGFCIRTGIPIPFDITKPLSYESFKKWNEYGDADYAEKFCHFTGESSAGETSVRQPILKKNWKKAKEKYGF